MKGRTTNEQFRKRLDQMVQTLRREITGGQYAVGDFLPPEKALAARFQFGNLSVRKGLELLVEEGLIEKIPKVGNRIRSVHSKKAKIRFNCPSKAWINCNMERLLELFHQKYPWIEVETVDMHVSRLHGIDVTILSELQFQELAESGKADMLRPLSSEWNEAHPLLADHYSVDGVPHMRPLIFSPIVLLYNRSHFHESGLPEPDGSWTWDDLIRAGERLSEVEGRYGFFFRMQDPNRWPVFLLQSGERFEWEDGKLLSLKGTALMDSIRLLRELMRNDKLFPAFLSENDEDVSQPFSNGKVSMTLVSYMALSWLIADHAAVDYDIAPIPRINEPRTLVISLGAGVLDQTKYPEEAELLLSFLVSEQAQSLIQSTTTSLPSLRALPIAREDGAGLRRPPRYGLYREMAFSFRTHSELNLRVREYGKLSRMLRLYIADMMDEEELCAEIERELIRPLQKKE